MKIVFKKFSDFKSGLIFELLKDSYSFDKRYQQDWTANWQEADRFFYDHLHIADACGFVTVIENEPIGFISWDPRNLPDYIEIGHNCIATKYKGNKYGKLQLQEAINRIKHNEVKKIIVTTDQYLIPAQRNYESVGFKLVRKRENKNNPEYAGDLLDYEILL